MMKKWAVGLLSPAIIAALLSACSANSGWIITVGPDYKTAPLPFAGMGKPESLRENGSVFWSRRIDESNRLVYAVNNKQLTIITCGRPCQD